MYNKNNIPQNTLIRKSIKNSWDSVFFISNQISLIISKLIIDNFEIDKKNIKIFLFRDIDVSIIGVKPYRVIAKKFDSKIDKIFWDSMTGKRIIRELKKNNKKFILYAEWATKEATKIINFRNCMGHNYIEQGQHSYMKIPLFNPKKLRLIDKFNINWKNKLSHRDEDAHFYFSDDAEFFIGINEDIYPCVPDNKKIILSNISSLKNLYKPKLKGVSFIGLTCATRRVNKNQWADMIKKLVSNLPEGGIVKPHPSFIVNPKIFKDFKDLFFSITKNRVKLCDNTVILELEMLHEKKTIIGPQTSLSRYAVQLGSNFKSVELY